jgi:hypothetical protein
MKNNLLKRIINSLLSGYEITEFPDNSYWMTCWCVNKDNSYEIDIKVFNSLIYCEFIEIDSGNFETGERHYIINIPNRTKYKLKNLYSLIDRIVLRERPMTFEYDILAVLVDMKIKEERKYKLKKLNAKSNIENI